MEEKLNVACAALRRAMSNREAVRRYEAKPKCMAELWREFGNKTSRKGAKNVCNK